MSSDAPEAADAISLAELTEGDRFSGLVLRVEDAQLRTNRRTGHDFLVGRLVDAGGAVDFIAFDLSAQRMQELRGSSLQRITAEAGVHAGRLQCRVSGIESLPGEPSAEDLARLFATTARDREAMVDDLTRWLVDEQPHPGLRSIARAYLDDEAFMLRFREWPAATSHHHAWRGGLLEHTWEVVRMARAVLEGPADDRLLPGLDRGLVLLGAFLHDLAKVQEIDVDGGFRYTPRGNLVGHLVGGAIDLERRLASLTDEAGRPMAVPAPVVDALVHIIISHHGRLEYGAAKLPATPEAVFVAGIDDLAARTSIALDAVGRGPGGGVGGGIGEFTDVHPALGTRLHRPRAMDAWPASPRD
ncbi:MAG: 3'-5' exoribonuclease YhaM family protein [Planctomycetota bacterium]|jgi:3'-5' exoribonuclease